MMSVSIRRGVAALVVLCSIGAACSNSDDVAGVQELADTVPTDETDASTATDEVDASTATDAGSDGEGDSGQQATDGFVFDAPTGDYVIVFPGEPTATPLPIPLPTGQAVAEAFIYEDGDDAAYFTSVFDYPDGAIDSDPETVLLGARDGAIANVGGTLRDSTFIERGGIPGVAFTFDIADGVTSGEGNALVFVDGLRLYQSFALGFSAESEKFQTFLDTFMFTDTAGDS